VVSWIDPQVVRAASEDDEVKILADNHAVAKDVMGKQVSCLSCL
jgi:hypothetical protein